MILKIINKFKNLDTKVLHIMKNGFKFSFIVCILSVCILIAYQTISPLPTVYDIGTTLFRTSLMFFGDFIICGVAFDTIKKQMA